MRFIIILVLFAIIGVVGSISGFLALDHDVNPCIASQVHFKGWGSFLQIRQVKINWPEFERTCPNRINRQKEVIPG